VPDAAKAVALALKYKENPGLSRSGDVRIPDFQPMAYWQLNELAEDFDREQLQDVTVRIGPFPYRRVTSLGKFQVDAQTVDQLQIRLSGESVCLGSLGIAARSPAGTVSLLKLPNDHFKADGWDTFRRYTLGSYAFHGEAAQGAWEFFTIASNSDTRITVADRDPDGNPRKRLSEPCPSTNDDGSDRNFRLVVEARIIAQ